MRKGAKHTFHHNFVSCVACRQASLRDGPVKQHAFNPCPMISTQHLAASSEAWCGQWCIVFWRFVLRGRCRKIRSFRTPHPLTRARSACTPQWWRRSKVSASLSFCQASYTCDLNMTWSKSGTTHRIVIFLRVVNPSPRNLEVKTIISWRVQWAPAARGSFPMWRRPRGVLWSGSNWSWRRDTRI